MKRISALLLALLMITATGFGQASNVKKGTKKLKRGEYELAIRYFEKALDAPETKAEASFKLGECYRLSNRIAEAEPFYRVAVNRNYDDEAAHLYYAFALKAKGDYKSAREQLEKYLRFGQDETMVKRATEELNNLDYIDQLLSKKNYFRIKNLDILNTSEAEYSPVYNDGELYFTSARYGGKLYKATGTAFTDIFRVKTKGAVVDTTSLQKLNDLINLPGINEGSVTFSRDGRTMIFARGNSGKRKGTQDVNLYITRFRNRKWSEPRMLTISEPGFWDSSPAFSRDGRTLYFASNRPGGLGGTDLYQARIGTGGRFGSVSNLGPDINTSGNEMFPYVSDDGHLYFSSDGHAGFGGLDIQMAIRESGKISVKNMGTPVNSIADDFGFFMYKPDRGFFSSNREGGKGDDDIYTFLNQDPDLKIVNYFLTGTTVTHEKNGETTILSNVKVELVDYAQNVIDEALTDSDGRFTFRVYEHEHYQLIADKQDSEDYLKTRLNFSTVGRSVAQEDLVEMVTNVTFDTTVYLEKIEIDKIFVLENIYYDFDRWEIRDDAAIELDKLVDVLSDNIEISIELSSHTDSVGADGYNMRLSQRRAESAVQYIVSAGIDPTRITAKGYGESRPIARNTNPDGTDNPEGRQRNRRTEFKITDIDKSLLKLRLDEEFEEDKYFDDDDEGDERQE